jgi:hypothetical protein
MGHSALNAYAFRCTFIHFTTCVNLARIMCLYIYLIKSAAHLGIFAARRADAEKHHVFGARGPSARRGSLHTFTLGLPYTYKANNADPRLLLKKMHEPTLDAVNRNMQRTGSTESVCNCESTRCDVTRATVERSSVHSCSYGLLSTVHSMPDSGEKTK